MTLSAAYRLHQNHNKQLTYSLKEARRTNVLQPSRTCLPLPLPHPHPPSIKRPLHFLPIVLAPPVTFKHHHRSPLPRSPPQAELPSLAALPPHRPTVSLVSERGIWERARRAGVRRWAAWTMAPAFNQKDDEAGRPGASQCCRAPFQPPSSVSSRLRRSSSLRNPSATLPGR